MASQDVSSNPATVPWLMRIVAVLLGLLAAVVAISKLATPGPDRSLPRSGRMLLDLNPPPDAPQKTFYSWMWGDAGSHLLGHELAELDPLRWSDWLDAKACMEDLQAWTTSDSASRPVEIMVGHNGGKRLSFATVDKATQYLSRHIGDSAPAPAAQSRLPAPAPAAQSFLPAPTPASPSHSQEMAAALQPEEIEKSANPDSADLDPLWAVLALVGSALCACLGCANLRSRRKKDTNEAPLCSGDDDDEESDFGKQCNTPLDKVQLRQVLEDVEKEEMHALPAPGYWNGSSVSRSQANKEIDRILATCSAVDVFGGRTGTDRKHEYRRLVRMLHPDKGLVSGERASLALRRVVDAHLTFQKRELHDHDDDAAE